MTADTPPTSRTALWRVLAALAGACVIAGVVARFWGLGKWPLAIDEYYFARSVQNVLHSGLPEFPCGGFYTRGLMLQYASALLQLAGLSPEFAPRLIAAVSSLIALPAVFLLGRRAYGRNIGLLAVAVLALSAWEVEMGRFARMYAPFQALFAWYLVYFFAFAVDRDKRARTGVFVLSALGVLVWEGGVFLPLINLLVPFVRNPTGRFTRRDWMYLAAATMLLIPAYWLATADLMSVGGGPLLPANYVPPPDTPSPSRLDAAVMPWTTLLRHPAWAAIALVPLTAVLLAVMRAWRSVPVPLGALGVTAVMVCALLHQFELATGILIILLLLSIVTWRELAPIAGPMLSAGALCALFWVAFALATHDWHAPGMTPVHTLMLLGYEFVRFPDVVREFAMPWGRTIPMLTAGLSVLVTFEVVRACVRPEHTGASERILLALVVILLLAASASHPPRHETRYLFFLYPLGILVAFGALARACQGLFSNATRADVATAVVCLGAFLVSEDFRPRHLWNIDTEAVNFRIGMGARLAAHYHPRSEVRAAAQWIEAHSVPGRDVVIVSFPGVDFYLPHGDYYYVDETDPRYTRWSCSGGTVQRWSNLPMLDTVGQIDSQVASGRRVWMIIEASRLPALTAQMPRSQWKLEWASRARDIDILELGPAAAAAQVDRVGRPGPGSAVPGSRPAADAS